jgi:hypothetical protein
MKRLLLPLLLAASGCGPALASTPPAAPPAGDPNAL